MGTETVFSLWCVGVINALCLIQGLLITRYYRNYEGHASITSEVKMNDEGRV